MNRKAGALVLFLLSGCGPDMDAGSSEPSEELGETAQEVRKTHNMILSGFGRASIQIEYNGNNTDGYLTTLSKPQISRATTPHVDTGMCMWHAYEKKISRGNFSHQGWHLIGCDPGTLNYNWKGNYGGKRVRNVKVKVCAKRDSSKCNVR